MPLILRPLRDDREVMESFQRITHEFLLGLCIEVGVNFVMRRENVEEAQRHWSLSNIRHIITRAESVLVKGIFCDVIQKHTQRVGGVFDFLRRYSSDV